MIAATLLVALVGGIAATPSATAHTCYGTLPSDCGPCTTGTHNHYTLLGCSSWEIQLQQ